MADTRTNGSSVSQHQVESVSTSDSVEPQGSGSGMSCVSLAGEYSSDFGSAFQKYYGKPMRGVSGVVANFDVFSGNPLLRLQGNRKHECVLFFAEEDTAKVSSIPKGKLISANCKHPTESIFQNEIVLIECVLEQRRPRL